jgi:hypothetical protein
MSDSIQRLEKLPYPVYFICKRTEVWQELLNNECPPTADSLYDKLLTGSDCWSILTYLQLKNRGLDVRLSTNFLPDSICVTTTYDELRIRELPFRSYVVICQADGPRPEICEQRVVQNHLNVVDQTDHFISHWPQPNLQVRDQSRGTTIESLVFKGFLHNLAESFRSDVFLAQLNSLGVSLSISSADLNACVSNGWIDYDHADLMLAVRTCTEYNLGFKPPSKLINAWLAGCPALLGPEPAFQVLRESELDYIEVSRPEDAIAAIQRLQENPKLYTAMIENGWRRASDFTPDRISQQWRDLLAGPIASGYEQWLHQSPMQKLIGRPLQFALREVKHKQERRSYLKNIHTGMRPVPC